jgi:hypothetical protein
MCCDVGRTVAEMQAIRMLVTRAPYRLRLRAVTTREGKNRNLIDSAEKFEGDATTRISL